MEPGCVFVAINTTGFCDRSVPDIRLEGNPKKQKRKGLCAGKGGPYNGTYGYFTTGRQSQDEGTYAARYLFLSSAETQI